MTTEELNALIAAEVAKGIAAHGEANAAAATPQATAPAGIRVNVGGRDLDYASADQLSAALNTTLSDFGRREQELKDQLAAFQNAGNQTSKDDAVADTFSQEEFIKNMTDDPRKGIAYVLSSMGIDPEQIKGNVAKTDVLDKSLAASQFKDLHPEYPGGNDVAAVIDKVRMSLNMPYNADGLDAAYNVAIQRGMLPNFPQLYREAQHYHQQNPQQPQFENPGPDTRQYQGGGVQPYFPNVQAGIQHDPRQFNGGRPNPAQNLDLSQFNQPQPPPYVNNPYLRGVPGVGRGGSNASMDYAAAGEQLSSAQIEAIFAQSGR